MSKFIKLILLVLLLMVIWLEYTTWVASAKNLNTGYSPIGLRQLSNEEILRLHLYETLGYNYKGYLYFSKLIDCESGWNPLARGDSGKAFSLLQFHEPTFNSFKEDAEMEYLNYKDPQDQITLSVWAFRNNLSSHWTCASFTYVKRLATKL